MLPPPPSTARSLEQLSATPTLSSEKDASTTASPSRRGGVDIEWEVRSGSKPNRDWNRFLVPVIAFFTSLKSGSSHLLSRAFPPTKRYPFNLTRTRFLTILSITVVGLLTLILGLAIGLSLKSSRDKPGGGRFPTAGAIQTGDLTYYNPGLGACGIDSTDGDMVAAVSLHVFDAAQAPGANPNLNRLCGRKVRARRLRRQKTGGEGDDMTTAKTIDITIVDRCVGCKAGDIDVSPAAFAKLAALEEGRVGVEWVWLEDRDQP